MPEKISIEASKLRRWYHEDGMTLSEIADEVDCSLTTIYNRMEEYGIERRTANQDVESYSVQCTYCGTEKEIPPCQYEQSDRFFATTSARESF